MVKSMKVPTGYVLQESDYPEVPPKLGQLGRWKRYTDPIVQDITIHAEYGNPIPGTPTDLPSLMSTGEEPYSSGYTAQPISTVTEEHSYIYAGGMLLRETITSGSTTKTLDFRYDNVGYPYALIYNNGSTTATYYYITNLQGDVMYLVDSNGNQVAAYTYDPYGKILSATGAMAEINPLRYRGYYYDSETGFYYLQSRYYDPNTCRFINADSYASTGQGLMGYNMFAYCNNNSVNSADPAGYAAWGTNLVSICDGSGHRVFSTEDAAAIEAGKRASVATSRSNKENIYGIYENGAGKYFVGSGFEGEHSSVSVESVLNEEKLHQNWTLVAFLHSHPNCNGHDGNNFSIIDSNGDVFGDALVAYAYNMPIYLAAPNGSLQILYWKLNFNGSIELITGMIGYVLPADNTPINCLRG